MVDPEVSDRLRATGERIDVLLDASGGAGVVARERAEELVRLVTDLYGAGIERILEILHDAGRLDEEVLAALAGDERVEQALESVRPYLGSHGGDVELLGVADDGTVRLRLLGSCDGCPSSAVTLTLAVEGAIESAAPEVTAVEVEEEPAPGNRTSGGGETLIPVSSLRSRIADPPDNRTVSWERVPELGDLPPGVVTVLEVGPAVLVACRVGAELFAYRDGCARCSASLR